MIEYSIHEVYVHDGEGNIVFVIYNLYNSYDWDDTGMMFTTREDAEKFREYFNKEQEEKE